MHCDFVPNQMHLQKSWYAQTTRSKICLIECVGGQITWKTCGAFSFYVISMVIAFDKYNGNYK